ncbi:hypothetical protein ACIRVK_41225 [Streptomyces sp. NPDC101152]|uniref:hypothetical protein n=1 Tax=Streptomyces sp. NPDC101152 TaxID=3366116 RepID=UPI0038055CC0
MKVEIWSEVTCPWCGLGSHPMDRAVERFEYADTLSHTGVPPVAGRPAVVISARGGGYGPGAPKEGLDYVVPTLEAVLGRDDLLGLDVTTVIPELTMAAHVPAPAALLALHEASLADAHEQAGRPATAIPSQTAA